MIHFLQQSHTHSNEATPPNGATPNEPSIQTHGSVGAVPIHTTIPDMSGKKGSVSGGDALASGAGMGLQGSN